MTIPRISPLHEQERYLAVISAYDLTYSVDLTAPAYSNRHSLTINGKNEDITREDLGTVGQNNDIQDYNALIDTV